MNIKAFLKLTPSQRDILFVWRVLYYPKKLTAKEITACTCHDKKEVESVIKEYSRNMRLKLEQCEIEKILKEILGEIFCEDKDFMNSFRKR